ncbi:putative BTB domain-containing protein [Seiridium cardinale]
MGNKNSHIGTLTRGDVQGRDPQTQPRGHSKVDIALDGDIVIRVGNITYFQENNNLESIPEPTYFRVRSTCVATISGEFKKLMDDQRKRQNPTDGADVSLPEDNSLAARLVFDIAHGNKDKIPHNLLEADENGELVPDLYHLASFCHRHNCSRLLGDQLSVWMRQYREVDQPADEIDWADCELKGSHIDYEEGMFSALVFGDVEYFRMNVDMLANVYETNNVGSTWVSDGVTAPGGWENLQEIFESPYVQGD